MYEEEHILYLLHALNNALKMHRAELGANIIRADVPDKLQRRIAEELKEFNYQSIVLLPPEGSGGYCPQCGRKL